MRMLRHLVAAVLVVAFGTSSPFAQQRHVVDPASLAGTVRQHAETQDADRALVRQTLGRPAVQLAATAAGIDLARLTSAVNTLSSEDVSRAAAAARDANRSLEADALVGGASTVTISTTTIIIGLLVLILLIVALD